MAEQKKNVVIVGGGAGGISAASSLLKRESNVNVSIVEPSETHKYQPGWTLVGGGVFDQRDGLRPMADVMPNRAEWVRQSVAGFEPRTNTVILEDGARLRYDALIVSPGIELGWDDVEGLSESLGRNGVTSNYDIQHAPYTWELVSGLREGRALFTQPPMPIKCAGAPQKAMYLSCYEWEQKGHLDNIEVGFHNAGGALFGVADYVPALEGYVSRYGIDLNFNQNLVAVDGEARKAWFDVDGERRAVEFDLLHVCPPQRAPAFVAHSPLADAGGWIEVDQSTLQHKRFENVFGLGDAISAPNAKTAAAVRKQAPVVAINVLRVLNGRAPGAAYDGYGSCPLTVERGKVVLAEFGYGGKLLPSFPTWLNDGKTATSLAWRLKAKWLPGIYFDLMLKGREWLAQPQLIAAPAPTPIAQS